jgi:hypothetical protein
LWNQRKIWKKKLYKCNPEGYSRFETKYVGSLLTVSR